jgi:HK97 gp10 family phage protein
MSVTTGRNTQFISGLAELTRQINALASLEEGKALKRCVKSGINEVLKIARVNIPVAKAAHRLKSNKKLRNVGARGQVVAPGFARKSLRTISTINADKNIASGILGVRKAAYYAVQFLEFGTRKMPAQPWLRRSLLEARDAAEAALKRSLQVSIDKAAKTK